MYVKFSEDIYYLKNFDGPVMYPIKLNVMYPISLK